MAILEMYREETQWNVGKAIGERRPQYQNQFVGDHSPDGPCVKSKMPNGLLSIAMGKPAPRLPLKNKKRHQYYAAWL